ncbi:MAG TPA: MOFRL family protein, partial [Thermomicrobiales bacterium]|nr:MOFRL family protein [Thermomicrobiales bacterium]
AACVSLILSDVLGNDPTVIASGPTVPRQPNPARALELLDRYRLRASVPAAVVELLEDSTTRGATAGASVRSDRDVWSIVGDNGLFLESLKTTAERHGLHAEIIWRDREGEARDLAREFVELCAGMSEDVDCVLGGGEATVAVAGDGLGGRNTEFALAAAVELAERRLPWAIASLASDGDDGANEHAAGGVVDNMTIGRGIAAGLDARDALERNDSGAYLRAVDAMFTGPPTGTNVNDAYIGIRLAK